MKFSIQNYIPITFFRYFKLLSVVLSSALVSCGDTEPTVNESALPVLNVMAVDKLIKVLPTHNYTTESGIYAHVARGEYATFQLILKADGQLKNISVSVDDIDFGTVNTIKPSVGKVGYVLAANAHTTSATDRIISATNYYPDPITEAENIKIEPNTNQPIWISIFVPRNAKVKEYDVNVKIHTENKTYEKALKMKVYNVVLSDNANHTLKVSNWIYFDVEVQTHLQRLNGGIPIEIHSELYWQIIRQYAQIMKRYGQDGIRLSPYNHTDFKGSTTDLVKADFAIFDKYIKIFKEEEISRIEGSHLAGLRVDGMGYELRVPYYVTGEHGSAFDVKNPIVSNFYTQFLLLVKEHMKNENYYQYIGDEPQDKNIESYIEVLNFVKSVVPNMKTMDAVLTSKMGSRLDDKLNVWVSRLDLLSSDTQFYQSKINQNSELWAYLTMGVVHNFPNRLIDLPLIKTRMFHWMNYKYNCTGTIHWGYSYWSKDPYNEDISFREPWSPYGWLTGGDEWLVYPGYRTLYPSIRLEAMRDGLNDYKLLKMLSEKNNQLAKEISNTLIRSFVDYETDIDTFNQMRIRLIETLSN